MPISGSLKPSTQQRPGTLSWNDFSGGLIADANLYPLMSSEKGLLDVLNYEYVLIDGKLKLKSRNGFGNIATGPGNPIKDIFFYTSPTGSSYTCFVSGNDLNKVNGSSYTKIEDLGGERGRMCQFNDRLMIADGGLHSWDGNLYVFENDTGIPLIETLAYAGSAGYICYADYPRCGNYIVLPSWGESTDTIAISSVEVVLAKVGSPTGNCNVIIYNSAGSVVTNGTSGNLDVSTLTTSDVAHTLTFSSTPLLTPGETYYVVVVYTGGDASNLITVAKTNRKYFPSTFCCGIQYASAAWTATLTVEVAMDINGGPHPCSTFVINKKDRIYCNDSIYPNRLYYSNVNDPEDFTTVNGGGFLKFDGSYCINAVKTYNDEIYIFCDNPAAIHKLSGDSPEEYTVALVKEGVTAYSQDVVQEVGGDLYFADVHGNIYSMRKILTTDDIHISNISDNKVYRSYLYTNTNDIRFGVNHGKNQLLVCYGSTSGYFLFYDDTFNAWGMHRITLAAGEGVSCFGPGNSSYEYRLGINTSKIKGLSSSLTTDDVGYFDLVAKTVWTDFGVLQDKDARFIDSVVISANQETYDLEIYVNLNTVTPIKTLSMVSLSQNGAFQSPYCGNLNEVNFNFKQIQAKVTAIASGTGPHWIDRIVVEAAILSHY